MKPLMYLLVSLRRGRRNIRIQTKLAVAFSLLLGLIALLIFLYFPRKMEQQALQVVAARAQSIGTMTAFSAEAGLYFEDIATVEEAAQVARQNTDLVYLLIMDRRERVWVAFNPAEAEQAQFFNLARGPVSNDGSIYRLVTPVLADGATIGHVYLGLSLAGIQTSLQETRTAVGWGSLILFLAGIGCVFVVSTLITRPLGRITKVTQRIAEGDLTQRVHLDSGDEVGRLARAFNRMVKRLEAVHQDLASTNINLEARQEELKLEVAEHERTQAALREAKEEAESATQAKSEFVASMSHEIRTPLNGVIGMTSFLMETALSEEQSEYARIIQTSGETLLSLINDILDFSKIEAGQLTLEEHSFDVRTCIEESLDLVAARAAEKGLELAYIIEDGVPATIKSDVTRIRQVLVNFLGNAIKFTEQGEVVVSVQSTPEGENGHLLHFMVRDTGIGIPSDRMDRLFKSFSQVDASTTRRFGGTGLGLAISKRLTEALGGMVWVESEENVGSTFHFTIKAQAAASTGRRLLQGQQPALAGRRVLIVDDNATNQRILSGQVRSWGMTPTCADSGAEALALVRDGMPFDVALLDMQMPEMDGQHLAAALADRRPHLPLVLCSSIGRQPDLPEELFAAALTKPIKQAQLYRRLVRVLERPDPAPVRVLHDAASIPEPDEVALRILVAEDNPVNQKVALMLLKRLGYRADIAANGLEALEALRRIPYDVVLMDVRMPEMDGLEATRRIVAEWPDEENRPCVVALTADVTRSKQEECKAAGMKGFLTKPVDRDQLAYVIEQCVKKKATRSTPQREPASPASAEVSGDAAKSDPALTRLKQMVGDDNPALLLELLGAYLEDLPSYLAQMADALASGEAETVGSVAHTLKSSSALMGAQSFSNLCRDLEAFCDQGATPDALAVKVSQVQEEGSHVRQLLTAISDDLQAQLTPARASREAVAPAHTARYPNFAKTDSTERA